MAKAIHSKKHATPIVKDVTPPKETLHLTRGVYREIPKAQINVDHRYQRTTINRTRVEWIAGHWSWVAFQVLTVAQRSDGSHWATDGQHRKLAADLRPDITTLPCMVFPIDVLKEEALAYFWANCTRGNPRMVDKFRALLIAEEPSAIGVQQLLDSTGHAVSDDRTKGVRCIKRLMKCYRLRPEVLTTIWPLIAQMCKETPIYDELVAGMFFLEQHLRASDQGSLTDPWYAKSLLNSLPSTVKARIVEARDFYQGGDKACAHGLANILNHKRSARRIEL
jgi:hypothetical protein